MASESRSAPEAGSQINFLDLPSEIRSIVYGHIFEEPEQNTRYISFRSYDRPPSAANLRFKTLTSIRRVCTVTREETSGFQDLFWKYTLSLDDAETVRTTLTSSYVIPNLRYLSLNLGSDLVHLSSLMSLVEHCPELEELHIAYYSGDLKEGMYENAARGESTPFLKPRAYNADTENLDCFLENFQTCLGLPRPF
jgi:hypothetical protein